MTLSNTNTANINVEKNIFGGLTTQDLTHNKVSRMIFVRHHLEDGWKVKLNGDHFIMKNGDGNYLAVTDECVIKMNYRDYIEEHGDILTYKEICIMKFILNALNDEWGVQKTSEKYIFSKNHGNKKEVLSDEYLLQFLERNFS